jgi:hypothetical protein
MRHGRKPSGCTDRWRRRRFLSPSFLARAFRRHIDGDYAHVRIQYRTPTQLGLLERFHQTLKSEEVYWQLYGIR